MAHEFAGAFEQTGRIRERRAVKKTHVYVRGEHVDVTERRIAQACHRTAVVQEFPDFVAAFAHFRTTPGHGAQYTCMVFHPRIDGGIRSRVPLIAVNPFSFSWGRLLTCAPIANRRMLPNNYFFSPRGQFTTTVSIGDSADVVAATRFGEILRLAPALRPAFQRGVIEQLDLTPTLGSHRCEL